MATTNDRTIEANGVATVTAPAEGAKVMLLSPSGVLTPVTMERLAELVRGTLQVGGRNYVRNSQTVNVVLHETNNFRFAAIKTSLDGLKKGDHFTISCSEFETSGTDFDVFQVALAAPSPNIHSIQSTYLSDDNKSRTIEIQEDYTGEVIVLVYAGIVGNTANKGITVSHLKVERGNIATDWTPAPEDIADLLTENRGG